MSNLRNSVRLAGFLGNDPEMRTIGNSKMIRLSIATNESYKNADGEKVEETQWHNLVFWNRNAVFAEKYLHKGSEVSIEGKLNNRNYTDKDGIKRYITEIIVNEILMPVKK